MYDVMLVDATHLANVTFHAAKSDKKIMQPMELHALKKLEKECSTGDLSAPELDELNRLRDARTQAIIGFACHLMITKLISSIKKFPANEIVMAWDNHSWRKNAYGEYKANRERDRQARTEDEALLYEAFYNLMADYHRLFSMTNVITLRTSRCEADDIVGTLCQKLASKRILVISGDSDYQQLLQNTNVHLFDPLKKKKVNLSPNEARWSLFFKIIRGDKKDNVPSAWPNVRETIMREMFDSPLALANAFKESKERMLENNKKVLQSIKKLNEQRNDLTDEDFAAKLKRRKDKIQTVGFEEAYKRNNLLLSFEAIPATIQRSIWQGYEAQKYQEKKTYSIGEWTEFIRTYKLKEILRKLPEIKEVLY